MSLKPKKLNLIILNASFLYNKVQVIINIIKIALCNGKIYKSIIKWDFTSLVLILNYM